MQVFPALAQQRAEFATVTLEPESTAKPPQLLAAATTDHKLRLGLGDQPDAYFAYPVSDP